VARRKSERSRGKQCGGCGGCGGVSAGRGVGRERSLRHVARRQGAAGAPAEGISARPQSKAYKRTHGRSGAQERAANPTPVLPGAMARPDDGRRLFKFLRKPLLLFPCCGGSGHVTAPVSRNAVAPEQSADSMQSRQDRFRPAQLAIAQEPVSKSEDASDLHPYHCPICFYFFAGARPAPAPHAACRSDARCTVHGAACAACPGVVLTVARADGQR
jgi:hypothetical protein